MGVSQIASIQALRAVAALAVLLAHVQHEFSHYGENPFPELLFGAAGVDLFFVISGFIMVYASEPLYGKPGASAQFLLRRIARIVPLYWAVSGLFLLGLMYRHGLGARPPAEIASSLAFLMIQRDNGDSSPILGVGWTLNYEMFFYCIFALFVAFPRRLAVIGVSSALFALVLIGESRIAALLPFQLAAVLNAFLFEFIFGVAIAEAYTNGLRISPWTALALIITGLVMIVSEPRGEFIHLPRHIAWGGASALIVAALVFSKTMKRTRGRFGQALMLLGASSYALYLTHTVTVSTLRHLVAPHMKPLDWPLLYAAILLVVSVGVGIAAHLLFERPITRTLQKAIPRFFSPALSSRVG